MIPTQVLQLDHIRLGDPRADAHAGHHLRPQSQASAGGRVCCARAPAQHGLCPGRPAPVAPVCARAERVRCPAHSRARPCRPAGSQSWASSPWWPSPTTRLAARVRGVCAPCVCAGMVAGGGLGGGCGCGGGWEVVVGVEGWGGGWLGSGAGECSPCQPGQLSSIFDGGHRWRLPALLTSSHPG